MSVSLSEKILLLTVTTQGKAGKHDKVNRKNFENFFTNARK